MNKPINSGEKGTLQKIPLFSKFINNVGFRFFNVIFSKEYNKFNKINDYSVYGSYGGIEWSKNNFYETNIDINENIELFKKNDPVDKMDIAFFYHDFCIEFCKNKSEIVEQHKILSRNIIELNQSNFFIKTIIYLFAWPGSYIAAYLLNKNGSNISNQSIDNIKKLSLIQIKKSDDYIELLNRIKKNF